MQSDVQAFHEKYGHPVTSHLEPGAADPRAVTPGVLRLRAALIEEECKETCESLRLLAHLLTVEKEHNVKDDAQIFDLFEEIVDGCADITYVTEGTAVSLGFDLQAHVAEVHKANMTKTVWPKAEHDKYGPGGKGPDFIPPNHRKLLQW